MTAPEAVPFRLRMKGSDTLDSRGARSVSYRAEGLLSLDEEDLRLDWTVERKIEGLSLGGVVSDVERFPYETTLVPLDWVMEVRLHGRLRPRLTIRAARLDAFDDMPSARPGTITLRLRRRDRMRAEVLVNAIEAARGYTG